jgi:O-antigen/teichoic acid export membrane protein
LGSYALIFAAVTMLAGVQQSLVTGPYRALGAPHAFDPRFVGGQVRLQLLIFIAEAPLLAGFLLLYLDTRFGVLCAAVALLLALQMHEFIRTVLATRLSIERLLVVDVVTHGVRLAALAGLAFLDELSLASALACIAGSCIVALLQVDGRWFAAAAAQAWAQNWRFGRWLMVESVAYFISTRSYLYVLGAVLGQQQVAALSASQNVANAVNVVAMGVSAAAVPIATLKRYNEGDASWRSWLIRVSAAMALATGCALAAIVVAREPLMHLLYPKYYAQFSTLLALLACGAWLEALSANLTTAFWSAQRPDLNAIGKVLAALFTLVWIYPAVRAYGVYGVAIGAIVTPIIWILSGATLLLRGKLAPARVEPLVTRA